MTARIVYLLSSTLLVGLGMLSLYDGLVTRRRLARCKQQTIRQTLRLESYLAFLRGLAGLSAGLFFFSLYAE